MSWWLSSVTRERTAVNDDRPATNGPEAQDGKLWTSPSAGGPDRWCGSDAQLVVALPLVVMAVGVVAMGDPPGVFGPDSRHA